MRLHNARRLCDNDQSGSAFMHASTMLGAYLPRTYTNFQSDVYIFLCWFWGTWCFICGTFCSCHHWRRITQTSHIQPHPYVSQPKKVIISHTHIHNAQPHARACTRFSIAVVIFFETMCALYAPFLFSVRTYNNMYLCASNKYFNLFACDGMCVCTSIHEEKCHNIMRGMYEGIDAFLAQH